MTMQQQLRSDCAYFLNNFCLLFVVNFKRKVQFHSFDREANVVPTKSDSDVLKYFVYNSTVKQNINLYTTLELTRIDRSLVY